MPGGGWLLNSDGTLHWQGDGPAPYIPPGDQGGLKNQIQQGGGFFGGSTPNQQSGVYSPSPGAAPIPFAGAGTGSGGSLAEEIMSSLGHSESGGGNVVSAPIGQQQGGLNDLFSQLLGGAGAGSGPLAQILFGLGSGSGNTNPLMDFFMQAITGQGGGSLGNSPGAGSSGSAAKDAANGIGGGGSPIAQNLFSLGSGILPPEIASRINAQVAESYKGARFGTDEAGAAAHGLARASEEQMLGAIQQMLGFGTAGASVQGQQKSQQMDALREILGLGKFTGGLEFQGGQNDLERALKEFLGTQNPLLALLPLLLQQGGAA